MSITTADGGSISYQSYQGKVRYSIYVPANVNPDTPIFTYTYGGGRENDWWSRKHPSGNYGPYDGLIQNGGDSIVIMPSMDWGDDWGANTMEVINSVREQYGITNLNVSGSGFSKGGFGGFDIVAENLKQNPNIDPQVVFFIDDYSSTYYMANHKLTPEKEQLFRDNNTIFIMYDPPWKQTENYQRYIDAGINLVRVEPDNYDHIAINSNFFKNGIFDYMSGDKLPDAGYTYKIYNRETGQWDVVDYESVATIDDLYSYYGINTNAFGSKVKKWFDKDLFVFISDRGTLKQYLNDISVEISRSSFLNADLTQFGGSSTTKVPSEISSAVQTYFSNVTSVLDGISSFTNDVAAVEQKFVDTDQSLEREVEQGIGVLSGNIFEGTKKVANDVSNFVGDIINK